MQTEAQFIVIEIDDGGAQILLTSIERNVIAAYLGTSKHWFNDLKRFNRINWEPGMWMKYPCGWIFCVKNAEEEQT